MVTGKQTGLLQSLCTGWRVCEETLKVKGWRDVAPQGHVSAAAWTLLVQIGNPASDRALSGKSYQRAVRGLEAGPEDSCKARTIQDAVR